MPARARKGSASVAAGKGVTAGKGLRLLIVEDVAAEAELAVRHLTSGGISCLPRTVADEREFRAALELFRPHLILSDFTLPAFDGLAALAIAREQAPDTPFIFLSGTLGEERARRRAAEREIARLTRRLKMQSGINSAVVRIRDRDELLREACRLAYEVGAYDRSIVFRVASDRRTATPWYWLGTDESAANIPAQITIGDGAEPDTSLTGRALRTGEIALRYQQQEDAAQYLASFDPLTGLAKRALFCQRLDQRLRNRATLESSPTVAAFDVMHLSKVNDSFGRHAGDLLLQTVAKRLKYHIPDDDRLGYLGGGTFVLVLPQEETSAESVTTLLENTVFREAFGIEGRVLRTSFRSGIARSPGDGKDGNTLAQRAEAALKQAKEAGEQYLHYQIEMHSDIAQRLALEHRLRVAVNVSAHQIRRRSFVEQVLAAARPCLAQGGGMDLEITETGLLHDVEGASRKLRELRAAGLRIALDDFGTGYSSLGLLSKLPVDLVKVDRSFIAGLPEDRASVTLVSSVIGLASAFGLKVVAEGVETEGQLEMLRRLGCDHSQGYLHSRPVPADELEKRLREQGKTDSRG
jgi:diguanylate cyclase (GGDEF)-like protein